ncbi:MAG: ATP-dependent DNA helicase RecG [Candidatus Magasanikbacteria bacterium]
MRLETKVSKLNRVGGILEKKLARLGMKTVKDLLFYYPFRYEDFSHIAQIKDLQDGQQVTICGKIELISNKRSPRKRTMITEAVVADNSEQVRVVWFGQPFITKTLKVGDEVFFSGKVKQDMFGVQMVSPSYEKVKKETAHTARIVPMYPLTAGITQKQIRFLMSQAACAAVEVEDWLPEDILEKADLVPLSDAIRGIHFPEDATDLKQSEKRLKFDELFILQLRGEMIRQSLKRSEAPELTFKEKEIKEFVNSLPFTLTKDQKVSSWQILQDLEKSEPMNRLLEGDVGSGKTVVAAIALLNCALNGKQAVIMAPTEILAKQHYESLVALLGEKVSIGLLTRSEFSIFNFQFYEKSKAGKKREVLGSIARGEVDIVIGTHALLSENVEFKDLGLVIIDEQHRFGVEQRKTIKEKSGDPDTIPHFLSMTATPIPRSFALTLYGDLDISIIREMPKGRKPVQTRVVDPHSRNKAYDFIRKQVKEGRQVFVICPLIQEKENKETNSKDTNNFQFPISNFQGNEKKTVLVEYEKLSKHIFSDLRVGFIHGKLKSKEKDETMKKFADGKTDILVSTSVVEVGVNIPNASVMMIEGAESFGLAQLHQFRGRVGRSDHQSYCFLFTDSDSQKVKDRLDFFEKTTDGFTVAEYDLEMRGPGEVYGKSQSGMMNLKFATMKDHGLIRESRRLAKEIDFDAYPSLQTKVKEWEESVHLE